MATATPQWTFDPSCSDYYYLDNRNGRLIYLNASTNSEFSQQPRSGLDSLSSTSGRDGYGVRGSPGGTTEDGESLAYSLRSAHISSSPPPFPSAAAYQPPSIGCVLQTGPSLISPQVTPYSHSCGPTRPNYFTTTSTHSEYAESIVSNPRSNYSLSVASQRLSQRSPSVTSSGQARLPFGRVEKGPAELITEPGLYEKGAAAYGKVRFEPGPVPVAVELDPNYQIRRSPRKFFRVGKVFKVLWPELLGRANEGVTVVTDTKFANENIATKIRWFVVVKEGHDCCSCLPILTYGKQGVAKRRVIKWHHSPVHTGKNAPKVVPEEAPKQGEFGMMRPVRVVPRLKQDRMDPLSRINYGKIYTVEHNVKVYDFGDVHVSQVLRLRRQWKFVLDRDIFRKLEPLEPSGKPKTSGKRPVVDSGENDIDEEIDDLDKEGDDLDNEGDDLDNDEKLQ